VTPNKNYHWRIAGFYFFYFAFVGMFAPYWSLYLQSIHFDAIQIAILMSVQPVMRMIAPNLWGWLADRTGKRLLVVQVAALGAALSYMGVFFTTQFYGLLLVMGLLSFFWSASMPLVEATTLSYLGKHSARYGRIRSWGSLGFIVAVLGLGYALQPQVLALFGACFLMAVAHGPYYTFYSIYLVDHGYAKSAVGWLWALGVLCEIAVFFAMPWLMRYISLTQVLMVSFACVVLRFLLIGWYVDTLPLLLLAQVLHAMTFGAFHAAAVALVHQFFQGRHQSRGQALFGSITYGAGGMLGGLISGPLWLHWGASVMFTFSAVAGLLGLLLMLWKLRKIAEHTR